MSSDSPNAAGDAGPDRPRIDEILTLISQNKLDPDSAARLLLGLDHSPALPETVESLIRRLGPPPPEVESDWKEQMRGIAAQWHASQRRPMPELSLADWIVDSQNRVSLSPAFFSVSDFDSVSDSPPTASPSAVVRPTGERTAADTAGHRRRNRLRLVAWAVAATILVTLVASIGSSRFGSSTGEPIATSTKATVSAIAPATGPPSSGKGAATVATPSGQSHLPPDSTSPTPEPTHPGSMPGNDAADDEPLARSESDGDFGRPATKWSLADLGFDEAASAADATDENAAASEPDQPADDSSHASPDPGPAQTPIGQPAMTPAASADTADEMADETADETAETRPGTPTPSGQPLAPLKIELTGVETSQKWQLPNRPTTLVSPELALEIRSPDTVTATWIRPPEPADARKQLSLIQWTLPGESSPALRCQIECRTTTRLQMRLRFAVQLDPQLPWQSVSQTQLAVALNQATTSLNRLLVDQSQWTKLYRTATTAEKKRIKPIKDELDLSVSRLQTILPSLQKLSRIFGIVDASAAIHFTLTDESIDDRPASPDTPPVRQVILQTADPE